MTHDDALTLITAVKWGAFPAVVAILYLAVSVHNAATKIADAIRSRK